MKSSLEFHPRSQRLMSRTEYRVFTTTLFAGGRGVRESHPHAPHNQGITPMTSNVKTRESLRPGSKVCISRRECHKTPPTASNNSMHILKLLKPHRIDDLTNHFISNLICTNFTRSQYIQDIIVSQFFQFSQPFSDRSQK